MIITVSTRPAIPFQAREHHCPFTDTKLYCLVTEALASITCLRLLCSSSRLGLKPTKAAVPENNDVCLRSLPLQMAERLIRAQPDSVANHVTACIRLSDTATYELNKSEWKTPPVPGGTWHTLAITCIT